VSWIRDARADVAAAGYDALMEPFPREAALALVRRLPAYGQLAWQLSRDPMLSRSRRAALVGAAAYLVSPIDAVPGVIPLVGQLDDLLVIFAAIRFALAGMSEAQRAQHLGQAGLTDDDLAADLRAMAAVGSWMVRGAISVGRRLTEAGLRAGTLASQRLVDLGETGVRRLAALRPDGASRTRDRVGRLRGRVRRVRGGGTA
jgi:uncharacterized membrane protein YkvA (DUF1232 family)